MKSDSAPHILVLCLVLAMFAGAVVLTPPKAGGQNVALGRFLIPPLCIVKRNTGIDCPGCGLTRSWISAVHGKLYDSLGYHRLGWLTMVYAALQALRHGIWLAVPKSRERLGKWGACLDRGIVLLAAMLLVNWLLVLFA